MAENEKIAATRIGGKVLVSTSELTTVPHDYIEKFVTEKIIRGIGEEIFKSGVLEIKKNPEFELDSIAYKTEIVAMTVDEFARLKAIERAYEEITDMLAILDFLSSLGIDLNN